MKRPPSIPNPKPKRYPEPGTAEELKAIDHFGAETMTEALLKFGPDNMGAAIAALCSGLGVIYGVMPPIKGFYRSPEAYGEAVKQMVIDIAEGERHDPL